MARNIEIKARVPNPSQLAAFVQAASDSPPQRLRQVDTFFSVPHGRLKLRVISGRDAELIYYQRDNKPGPKKSSYKRFPVWLPRVVRRVLSLVLLTRGEVVKERFVYKIGQTRIHLDHVQTLGVFVELEVVLSREQTEQEGIKTAERIMDDLQISESDLVELSYIDLLTISQNRASLH